MPYNQSSASASASILPSDSESYDALIVYLNIWSKSYSVIRKKIISNNLWSQGIKKLTNTKAPSVILILFGCFLITRGLLKCVVVY